MILLLLATHFVNTQSTVCSNGFINVKGICHEVDSVPEPAVLFLNNDPFLSVPNMPQLIHTNGQQSTSFVFNGYEVSGSCGVTHQNVHYIFGGYSNEQQILQVENCELINIGKTEFDHHAGSCGSTGTEVVLCFNGNDSNDFRRCRYTSAAPTGAWSQLALSAYDHSEISIGTSPVGSYSVSNKKGELYSFTTGSWSMTPDFPSTAPYIAYHKTIYVSKQDAYYIIGGWVEDNGTYHGSSLNTIIAYQHGEWTKVGTLNSARHAHAAVWLGDGLMVMGGASIHSTERCMFTQSDGMFNCTEITPFLDGYYYGSAAFLVIKGYC